MPINSNSTTSMLLRLSKTQVSHTIEGDELGTALLECTTDDEQKNQPIPDIPCELDEKKEYENQLKAMLNPEFDDLENH